MDRLKTLTAPLASLKLTVVLFVLAMVLVFAGTLAQREAGNWEVVSEYFRSFWVMIPLRHLFFRDIFGWSIPFPGGFVIIGALLVNLIAAHVSRFQFAWKRTGILVIHAGLILMIAGELVTAALADEGMMMIRQGSYSSFVEDLRDYELAVIRPGEDEERVTVIPARKLAAAAGRGVITHPDLPFDIAVRTWMHNSALAGPQQMQGISPQQNPATAGNGLRALAIPQPRITGVESNESNQPAAYVQLTRDGDDLGAYLVSTNFAFIPMFDQRQVVEVDGEAWHIELRFKRVYLPYTLHLLEARHDTFVGTTIPRNFSSLVRIDDPEANEDRQVLIWMNNPLRYRGQTFYQAQMGQSAEVGGVPITGLQVVTNPGWLIPYISCGLVSLGLTWHFGVMLWKFVGRTPSPRAAAPVAPGSPSRPRSVAAVLGIDGLERGQVAAATIVVAASLLYLGTQLRPQVPTAPFDMARFAAVPVTADGRVKPWDTVARSTLLVVSGRQTYRDADEGRISATQWFLDALTRPEIADRREVFRIDDPDVKELIGVPMDQRDRIRFSFNEIMREREELVEQVTRADSVRRASRSPFQQHLVEVAGKLNLYGEHRQLVRPHAVPPHAADQQWQPLGEALHAAHAHGDTRNLRPTAALLSDALRAYAMQDADRFNAAIGAYHQQVRELFPDKARKAGFEVVFNRFAPFYQGTVFYTLAFLFGFFAVLMRAWENPAWAVRLGAAAVALLLVALVIHSFGIAARMWLQGRPPVTNLYSSAVFIGWVSVLLGLFIERVYRNQLGVIAAAAVGVCTLIVAHNLAGSGGGDTMEMMQAVLDSNFWLATHVITITIGYAAVFLAGAIGIAYLILGVYTPYLRPHVHKAMGKMMYGTTAFALIFSFVGTVLGGIWADQSWGRFWGWDPKENGAILIVLLTALILHARWGGMIRERGIAVLAVGGNIVTAWSWFGTNLLGVGLHSYGFMDGAMFWLLAFVLSQTAIMSIGLIPIHRWASYEALSEAPVRPQPAQAPRPVVPPPDPVAT
jgi:ABC-type transport system involved in cytochrome c biogenesis permease subunit